MALRSSKQARVFYAQLTISREAAGAAAFQRGFLLVGLEKLRSSPLRLLDIDENPRKASNPAVLVVRGR